MIVLVLEDQDDRFLGEIAPADQPLVVLLDQQRPVSRIAEASLGKIPTTSERRPISLFSRSSGFVLLNFDQWACGKL